MKTTLYKTVSFLVPMAFILTMLVTLLLILNSPTHRVLVGEPRVLIIITEILLALYAIGFLSYMLFSTLLAWLTNSPLGRVISGRLKMRYYDK